MLKKLEQKPNKGLMLIVTTSATITQNAMLVAGVLWVVKCQIIKHLKINIMNFESKEDYEQYIGREQQEQMENDNASAQADYENEQLKLQNVVFEQIEKAQDALSALCKNPSSFSMRVPADEEKDTDLIIAKALRYANQMRIALDKIVVMVDLFDESKLPYFLDKIKSIAINSLSGQCDIVEPVKSLDNKELDF
jgi:hypothetical protein